MHALLAMLLTTPSTAAPLRCPTPAQRQELASFNDRLRRAESPEEARRSALRELGRARRAVDRGLRFVPGDGELAAERDRLAALEADVAAARSQAEVADRLDAATVTGQIECHYSTGEVVAVVIGFVLGILPGVVLLVLLC